MPACCVQVAIQHRDAPGSVIHAQSIYLPPDGRDAAVAAYVERMQVRDAAEAPLYVAGDVNVQVAEPRTDAEAELTKSLVHVWAEAGSAPIHLSSATRKGASGSSQLDVVVAPARGA